MPSLHHISAILLDTKGPEIRTGFFADKSAKTIQLKKGETIILTSDYSYPGDAHKLACSYATLATSVSPGQTILIADGSLVLTVLSTDTAAREISCRIENDAAIGERKNMNLPGVIVDLPTVTAKDVDDIVNFGIRHQVDFVAASFVRKASDVQHLRQLLADNNGQDIKIICKIENQEGLENYNSILQATDGIMVARYVRVETWHAEWYHDRQIKTRVPLTLPLFHFLDTSFNFLFILCSSRGDLGMEIPPSKVFLAQKMMIREANLAGKPVVTATQMLESMITNPRPTRAECSDVANAVLDGTDCVMLSGETANGPYFEAAVRVMARTCCEAEHSRNYDALFAAVRRSVVLKYNGIAAGESLASSAVKTAIETDAKLIVCLSETGNTARLLAKYRPGRAIVCLTTSPSVARQCVGVLAGVHAYTVESLHDDVALTLETGREAVQAGIAAYGDRMVVVSGTLYGEGKNNQIRVEKIIDAGATPTASGGHLRKLRSFVIANLLDEAEQ